jgi:hypothetical protein
VARSTSKPSGHETIELVAGILEEYAQRGTFRGFARGPARSGRARFKMQWHRDRMFELVLDTQKNTLQFPVALPEVPASSSMYREFREFITSRQAAELPAHRRIDPAKANVRAGASGGNASLTLTVLDGDYDYATRAMVTLLHEVYVDFLYDGRYYDYLIETFDLDPDHVS